MNRFLPVSGHTHTRARARLACSSVAITAWLYEALPLIPFFTQVLKVHVHRYVVAHTHSI